MASYVPVAQSGKLLFLSGQLPLVEGKLPYVGKVGEGLTLSDGQKAAQIAVLNALSAIKSHCGSLDTVKGIIRMTVYVASASGFTDQHLVANGASDLLVQVFGTAGRHARLSLGSPVLPLDAPVELEMIVEVA